VLDLDGDSLAENAILPPDFAELGRFSGGSSNFGARAGFLVDTFPYGELIFGRSTAEFLQIQPRDDAGHE
jgi:hypothetical protein